MGLTNHILRNVIGGICFRLPQGREERNSLVQVINSNQVIGIIKSSQVVVPIELDQRMELNNSGQVMVLIQLNQDIP